MKFTLWPKKKTNWSLLSFFSLSPLTNNLKLIFIYIYIYITINFFKITFFKQSSFNYRSRFSNIFFKMFFFSAFFSTFSLWHVFFITLTYNLLYWSYAQTRIQPWSLLFMVWASSRSLKMAASAAVGDLSFFCFFIVFVLTIWASSKSLLGYTQRV